MNKLNRQRWQTIGGWLVARRWQAALAGGLMLLLLAILLMPTVKTLRTVEVGSEQGEVALSAGEEVAVTLRSPQGVLAYVLLWVKEGHGGDRIAARDYDALRLQVQSADGAMLQEAASPSLIKREDKAALLFALRPMTTSDEQPLHLVVHQSSAGTVRIRDALPAHVHEGEQVPVALQLGEPRNWITLLVDKVYEDDFLGSDLTSYLHRGSQIVRGKNPYTCALGGPDSCVGYPAHLPGMYVLSAGLVSLGVDDIVAWESFWRMAAFVAWIGVGLVLFGYLFGRGQPALAVAALGFWLFNRWSIEVLRVAHTDFTGVLFLLAATLLLPLSPYVAAVLIGTSLAVKQVAVLVVPLFIIYAWRHHSLTWPKLLLLIGLVAAVPLFTAVPFLIDNPLAVVTGATNIAARPAQSVHGFAPSLAEWLDVTHIGKLAPLFALAAFVYVAAWRRAVSLIGGTLLVLAISVSFTHVLFNQYFVWFLAFVPLAAAELIPRPRGKAGPTLDKTS